jgi:hypothetical protein
MWDEDQLAEMAVIIDRLQASGDPFGEWLAIRGRLELEAGVPKSDRRTLRARARSLREQLGPRWSLAGAEPSARVEGIRERGFLVDVSLGEASPERLDALLDRPDAAVLLRLRLRGDPAQVWASVEQLLARARASSRSSSLVSSNLRELAIDVELPAAATAELTAALAVELPRLFSWIAGPRAVPLAFAREQLERAEPWSARRRTTIGRALASGEPRVRRRALEQLATHAEAGNQLRSVLFAIIEGDPDPEVRRAAFAVVPGLGSGAAVILALAIDAASEDDPQLREWLGL